MEGAFLNGDEIVDRQERRDPGSVSYAMATGHSWVCPTFFREVPSFLFGASIDPPAVSRAI
jgi:hypothetical protein